MRGVPQDGRRGPVHAGRDGAEGVAGLPQLSLGGFDGGRPDGLQGYGFGRSLAVADLHRDGPADPQRENTRFAAEASSDDLAPRAVGRGVSFR
ncbi:MULTISPECIES: hypothetical protein [unclassified Streptomyces]|uniref:hypothetical protein n=1 Tax=unclassified Streptomyces TaxID=2593676 RepID=UPI000BD29FD6|nr:MULTISPECIES: hypothetical protein [unclassified Streptomyces]SOD50079.1 hypothetical protein SAMN06272727_7592 [Streptomyces sp. Ag82_G6-1]